VAKAIIGTLEGKNERYGFSTPEQLIADFLADVRRPGAPSNIYWRVLVSAACRILIPTNVPTTT